MGGVARAGLPPRTCVAVCALSIPQIMNAVTSRPDEWRIAIVEDGGLDRFPTRYRAYGRLICMSLLIDGYNLMYAAGIFGQRGRTSLEASRYALLRHLSERLDAGDYGSITVVFDAREAPPGLPRQVRFAQLQIHFADRGEEADDLLERLILADHAPRKLTVVSSDHRVQRAARRRRARALDSERWWTELHRPRDGAPLAREGEKPEIMTPPEQTAKNAYRHPGGVWLPRELEAALEEEAARAMEAFMRTTRPPGDAPDPPT